MEHNNHKKRKWVKKAKKGEHMMSDKEMAKMMNK